MKRWVSVWLVIVSVALCGSAAFGQTLAVAASAENTLTVTVTGTAESLADWAEVNLTVEGRGLNAQEALGNCQATSRGAMDELLGLGIPEGDIRCGPPEISTGGMAQMMGQVPGDDAQGKFVVTRRLTVRLTEIDPETLYEDACAIIDLATESGAGPKTPNPWSGMMTSESIITFGVDDLKALRNVAIAGGLAQAKEVAELVATQAGRKISALGAVAVQEYGTSGLMAMYSTIGSTPTSGQAVHRVMLTVTYELE